MLLFVQRSLVVKSQVSPTDYVIHTPERRDAVVPLFLFRWLVWVPWVMMVWRSAATVSSESHLSYLPDGQRSDVVSFLNSYPCIGIGAILNQ